MSDTIIICGVLIHAHPDKVSAVSKTLEAKPGIEVHHRTGDGRLIITVEADHQRTAGDRLLELNNIEGVLTASLVYHHFESEPDARVLTGE